MKAWILFLIIRLINIFNLLIILMIKIIIIILLFIIITILYRFNIFNTVFEKLKINFKDFGKTEEKIEEKTEDKVKDKTKDIDKDKENIDTSEIENFFESEKEESKNKQVFLDIKNDNNLEKIIIELDFINTPITAQNFYKFCIDKKYINIPFHRIIDEFMVQGGDIVNKDGSGSISNFNAPTFKDENFINKHLKGSISMANSGPNTNGSQFFITINDTPWLDNKHVVFGKVLQGMDYITHLSKIKTNENNKPMSSVIITDCGEIN